MKNRELGKAIYDVVRTRLDFETWYNQCFAECVEDAAGLIDSGCCTAERGSFCEISKTISKDGQTHNFDFDKDNFIEFYGKDGFENRFFPKE
jgi:hypothetical protein